MCMCVILSSVRFCFVFTKDNSLFHMSRAPVSGCWSSSYTILYKIVNNNNKKEESNCPAESIVKLSNKKGHCMKYVDISHKTHI